MLIATIPQGFSPACFPIAKGIRLKGNQVAFDNSFTALSAERVLESFFMKAVPNGEGSQYIAKKIKDTAKKALKRSDVEALGLKVPDNYTDENHSFYRLAIANTKIDRVGDKLTKSFLERLAKNVNDGGGVSLLYDHNQSHVLGKIFHEQVERMSADNVDDHELIGFAAVNKKASMPNHPNMTVDEGIHDEMLNFVSIGFRAIGEIKQLGDKVYQEFDYNDSMAFNPEQFEASLVYFPAQYGAKVKAYMGKEEKFDVSIFNLKTLTKKNFIMAFEIEIGGEKIPVTPEVATSQDGTTTATVKGLDVIQEKVKALEAKATKYDALEKLFIESNQEAINDVQIIEGEKGLNKSYKHTEDELKSMLLTAPAKFKALYSDLKAEQKKTAKPGQLGNPGEPVTTKSFADQWS